MPDVRVFESGVDERCVPESSMIFPIVEGPVVQERRERERRFQEGVVVMKVVQGPREKRSKGECQRPDPVRNAQQPVESCRKWKVESGKWKMVVASCEDLRVVEVRCVCVWTWEFEEPKILEVETELAGWLAGVGCWRVLPASL